MNFIARLFNRKAREKSHRLDLEERKTLRRELVFQSIREHMLSLEVISSMYRFRVMNLDERHHRFAVMIEVSSLFEAKRAGMILGLNQVEDHLRIRTRERYGVHIDKVYWRVDENATLYSRHTAAKAPPPERPPTRKFEPITPEEKTAFAEALRRGRQPQPVVDLPAEMYESALTPLESKSPTGQTQYATL